MGKTVCGFNTRPRWLPGYPAASLSKLYPHELAAVMPGMTGNLPLLPRIFPDYAA